MKINRVWAMPNSKTFQIKPIKDLLKRYVKDGNYWADPFANDSKIVELTNDLNHNFKTKFHLDCYDFLKILKDDSCNGILFDPPYSIHQINEMYEGIGLRKKVSVLLDLVSKKVKVGGHVISFGWNSNGLGKKRGFEIVEILLIAHGGSHNDTIVVVEKKCQNNLPKSEVGRE